MRNLRNLKHAVVTPPGRYGQLSATAWDSKDVICAFGPKTEGSEITLLRLDSDKQDFIDAECIASWKAPSPHPDLAVDRILSLHHTGMAICLVLEGGDLITVSTSSQGAGDVEIVGSVDAGISAASWSPDGDLLVILAKDGSLIFLNSDLEETGKTALDAQDLTGSNHVSIGWGKSETQFKGRGAKAMRDPTVPEHIDEGKLSALDDGHATISWRGDCQYVAINTVSETEPRRRVIRVYTREAKFDSASEPVDFLLGALSWKPSGQVIAGAQVREGRIDVVFFERNGLRHGEFSLRIGPKEVDSAASTLKLDWNHDSSVLAVSINDRVQLWTMNNYHYYLKQDILLAEPGPLGANCLWHPEHALHLCCVAHNDLRYLAYSFEIARGRVDPPFDTGTVVVIDGKKLKITPLQKANVPPPMAFDEVDLPCDIIDVIVNAQGTRIAALHDGSVSMIECNYNTSGIVHARLSRTIDITGTSDRRFISRQILFSDFGNATEEQVAILVSPMVSEARESSSIKAGANVQLIEARVNSIFCQSSEHGTMLFHPDLQQLTRFDEDRDGTSPIQLSVSASCTSIETWHHDGTSIFVGRAAGGTLQVWRGESGRSVSLELKIPGCTSFAVTDSHLIFTTSSHLLKFMHLHNGELEIPADSSLDENDERVRRVERGAKIVTVIPSAYSLVLQMPRGNLETIYPRALVLAGIRRALDQQDYKKAFSICRIQRVDMNILHDYAPDQFMQDVESFVKQIKKTEHLDLFLSSLLEEDVCKTLYVNTSKVSPKPSKPADVIFGGTPLENAGGTGLSKVNRICDRLLSAFSVSPDAHLQNIVTAHVCKNPPDLEAGLSLVSELRKKQDQEQLEHAVEHICFLADVNQLYDTALGIYDLDVALLVAQQSQKDPREYLPYLQNLHEMDPLRQCFAIDNDLKRYSKALTHLHALDDFEELKLYATKHELYSQATELYRYDKSRLTDLMRLHAYFLSSRNRYKEAGIAYEYVSDYAAAYEAYRSASMWRECLSCAGIVQMPVNKISEVAKDLADSLEEAKTFAAAATIHLEYLQDLPTAVKLLCRGYQFAEAIRLIAVRRQSTLLLELIDPGLIEASATMTEMLAEMKTQLNKQIPRLRELRQKKAENPMSFLDDGDADADIPDNISLAPTDASTSGGTFMTRYTNNSMGTLATNATRKTSKNRRREERKRARGKKGTVYEEEYLVNSIARLVERLNAGGEDVERLIEGLMRRTMRERAVAVDAAFWDVVEMCKACSDEVFGKTTTSASQTVSGVTGEATPRPMGGEGVLWEALSASQQKQEAPVLKSFERLSLLERQVNV